MCESSSRESGQAISGRQNQPRDDENRHSANFYL